MGPTLPLLLFLAFAHPSPCAAQGDFSAASEVDHRIRAGLDGIYRMDFDGAQREFERLRELDGDNPYYYFGSAAVAWSRYVYETDQTDQSLIAPFESSVRTSVEKSKAWLKTHPRDANAYLVLGAGEGIWARLQVTRREYVKGYFTARDSMKSIHAALAIDPDLYDARLGTGMYDYYTDLYPRMLRFLARIILHGDRARGLQTLRLVAQRGRYMSVAAKLLLVEIYNADPYGAKDPQAAVRLIEEVRKDYPDSAMFHAAHVASLYEAGRYEEAKADASEFVRRSRDGTYRPIELAKAEAMLGTVLWTLGEKEKALEAFEQAGQVRYRGAVPRYGVWGLIRAGQSADLLGRREKAVELYRQVAQLPDYWDYRGLAVKCLSKPYPRVSEPLDIQPP